MPAVELPDIKELQKRLLAIMEDDWEVFCSIFASGWDAHRDVGEEMGTDHALRMLREGLRKMHAAGVSFMEIRPELQENGPDN